MKLTNTFSKTEAHLCLWQWGKVKGKSNKILVSQVRELGGTPEMGSLCKEYREMCVLWKGDLQELSETGSSHCSSHMVDSYVRTEGLFPKELCY